MIDHAAIGAANGSEVLQKTWQHGRDADEVAALLLSLGLEVQSVTAEIAAEAARIWSLCSGLSLGGRLCLATGRLPASAVWTADRRWAGPSLRVLLKVVR
jgi:ribonuclease VapC